jgi:uncharacterized RmlC-like cupin family protein
VGQTTQTTGMRRLEAISGKTVGATNLWMGQTHVPASTSSGNHHHGSSETAIYVVSGNPVFVFLDVDADEPAERRIEASPGDYIFVPPFVPHREENPDPESEAIVVIARTTQEAIVVNLAELSWAEVTDGLPLVPLSGRRRLPRRTRAFTHDGRSALASLTTLDTIDATLLLPGSGTHSSAGKVTPINQLRQPRRQLIGPLTR